MSNGKKKHKPVEVNVPKDIVAKLIQSGALHVVPHEGTDALKAEDLEQFIKGNAAQFAKAMNDMIVDDIMMTFVGGVPMHTYGAADQFDRMTRRGYKLDLLAGIYRRAR